MKPHLPYRLYRALLAALTLIPSWIYAAPAATIPEGYTEVVVHDYSDVAGEASGKYAFLLGYVEGGWIFSPDSWTENYRFASLFYTSDLESDGAPLTSITFQNFKDANGPFYTTQNLSIEGMNEVTFLQNSCGNSNTGGGAIYGKENINLIGNKSIRFNKNRGSGRGGAIYCGGELTISKNGEVAFNGNRAVVSSSTEGGAIYGFNITISSNERVIFSENFATTSYAYYGGAISAKEGLSIVNNGYVLFEGNYTYNADYNYERGQLSSINSSGDLILSAREGGCIEFRDSVKAGGGGCSLNGLYTDGDGVVHPQTGDILFTGKYISALLSKVPYSSLLPNSLSYQNSLKSSISAPNLYDGRLCIEDGAEFATGSSGGSLCTLLSQGRPLRRFA